MNRRKLSENEAIATFAVAWFSLEADEDDYHVRKLGPESQKCFLNDLKSYI